jgi:hypothetical protein
MRKLSQLARLELLEKSLRPDPLIILNPRHIDCDCGLSWDEHEAKNAQRIAAARKAGHKIIEIGPTLTFNHA